MQTKAFLCDPIKINHEVLYMDKGTIPDSILHLITAIESRGFYMLIKGGRPRRLLRLAQLALHPELAQDERTQLEYHLAKSDWDLITNAPQEIIESFTGRHQNKYKTALFLRFYNYADTGSDLDILYNLQHKNLAELGKEVDFCARGICMDKEGRLYDSTGKGYQDIFNQQISSPVGTDKLFQQNPIAIFTLIETLVKYHQESPACELEMRLHSGLRGLYDDSKPGLAKDLMHLDKLDAGQCSAKLLSLLQEPEAETSLYFLMQTGLMGYLFPDLTELCEQDLPWFVALMLEKSKTLNNQAPAMKSSYLLEAFIVLHLYVKGLNLVKETRLTWQLLLTSPLFSCEINSFIGENRYLRAAFRGSFIIVFPHIKRILQILKTIVDNNPLTAQVTSQCDEYRSKIMHFEEESRSASTDKAYAIQGIQYFRAANLMILLENLVDDPVEKAYLKSKIAFYFLLSSLMNSQEEWINSLEILNLPYNEKLVRAYQKQSIALVKAVQIAPGGAAASRQIWLLCQKFRANKQYNQSIAKAKTFGLQGQSFIKQLASRTWDLEAYEPLHRSTVIHYIYGSWLNICGGRLTFASHFLEEAGNNAEPLSAKLAAAFFRQRAHLNNLIADPLEAMKSWEQSACLLEQDFNQYQANFGLTQKTRHLQEQAMAWKQALDCLFKFSEYFENNPCYFDTLSAGNYTVQKKIEDNMNLIQKLPDKIILYKNKILTLEKLLQIDALKNTSAEKYPLRFFSALNRSQVIQNPYMDSSFEQCSVVNPDDQAFQEDTFTALL